jgi:hypothetical protein
VSVREQVMERISLLSPDQLKKVSEFLDSINPSIKNVKKENLNKSQKEALDLLNYTIETGITDLARNHDKYLYKRK